MVSAESPRPEPAKSRFERAVFIIAAPGSGASLLRDTVSRTPGFWSVGEEVDRAIEAIPELHPANRGWDSNRLAAHDVSPQVVSQLEAGLLDGGEPTGLRLLHNSPKNALRVPFLNAVFPDALFIHLTSDPAESLREMISAWESGARVTYPELPGWEGLPWSLALTPEWRNLGGVELPELVAEQWRMATEIALRDLKKLQPERWITSTHEGLISDPRSEVARLRDFLEAIEQPVGVREGEGESPYRSVSSGSFAQVLAELATTVLVSTYQTGKLVAVRSVDGALNTHFRALESPMGISHHQGRLAVGTKSQVWEYQNLPALTEKLEPPGRHDACFVPRRVSYTGDIRIHDVAWAGGELWFVATRFSCLATLDGEHSFVPRWRPPFISGLAAEDRCHLNGMAVIHDEVRYVTALGETDTPGGWRENKASGGVLIDVESSETVVKGLSMPHSPRWHRNRLWILESGEGTLATVDLDAGTVETVAVLPGFTRGLAFAGPLAFIGLSEVREATTFGGLPLTARLEERQCGVWVVNIETGETIGFLRFEDLVEEIFDVCLLPGMRFPEIAEHGSDAVNSSFVVPDEALA